MTLTCAKGTHGTIGHTEWSSRNGMLRAENTTLRLPEVIGEASQ